MLPNREERQRRSVALQAYWRSRLIRRARRWTRCKSGRRIRAIQLDRIEASFASPLGVVKGTGSLDLPPIRRGWVWSGNIPSDTGIHTPGISLNPLITVTGEIIVPVLSSPKKQGSPQRIFTLILNEEGTRCMTVPIVAVALLLDFPIWGASSNRVKIYCSVLYAMLTGQLAPISGFSAHVIT